MAELGETQNGLSIETRRDDAALAIALGGDLDMSNAPALEQAIAESAREDDQRLLLDVGALRFMDSAGIAVLLGALSRFGAVTVRDPSPVVRRVIEVTGLSGVLDVEP